MVKPCADRCMLQVAKASTSSCGGDCLSAKLGELLVTSLNAEFLGLSIKVESSSALPRDVIIRRMAVPVCLKASVQIINITDHEILGQITGFAGLV